MKKILTIVMLLFAQFYFASSKTPIRLQAVNSVTNEITGTFSFQVRYLFSDSIYYDDSIALQSSYASWQMTDVRCVKFPNFTFLFY